MILIELKKRIDTLLNEGVMPDSAVMVYYGDDKLTVQVEPHGQPIRTLMYANLPISIGGSAECPK